MLLVFSSSQSPASARVASAGHAMGHCKVKCGLYSVQQVWWSLHWELRPRWAEVVYGFAVLLNARVFQMHKCHSAATVHRALPVCDWPALGMQ